jgi:hypothetical protein
MSRQRCLHFLYKALVSFPRPRYNTFSMKQVACAIAIAVLGVGTAGQAYTLTGKSWPNGSVLVLQLELGAAGRTLQDGNISYDLAVLPVAEMWNQRIQRASVVNVLNPVAFASPNDRLNSVVFSNSVFGQSFGSNTLAVTYYSSIGSSMVESDTLFNRAITFDSYRGPLQFVPHGPAIPDIRRVFLHELGHTLGLGHPDTGGQQVTAVMNSIVSNQEVLANDDISGGQYLYGASVATPTPTPAPTATPGPSGAHLVNISTRMNVGTGPNVLIGGFIVQGSQSKTLIVRAMGPSLAASGVTNVLMDPVLDLHDSTGAIIASNNNWQDGPQAGQILEMGFGPASSAESAVFVTVSPGSFTAVVSGWGGGQGTGLVEVYEMDENAVRMMNISTRGPVGMGGEPLIGGLIVQGGNSKKIIVRALGPSLAGGPSPIAGALADPTLELRDGSGNLLASNDDWGNSPQAGEIAATIPPTNALESALIIELGSGNCTAIVRGANGTFGIGLVEVFDLDP